MGCGVNSRISGLTWDAELGLLFGIGWSEEAGNIYAIDPATGDQTLYAASPHAYGWEGLVSLRGSTETTPVAEVTAVLSSNLRAFPNPFGTQTTIGFDMADVDADAFVAAYDVAGRLVRRLSVAGAGSAGRYEMVWDGRSASGRDVPAGMYFLRLEGSTTRSTAHKVFVVR